jgi:hypothetical protein
MKMAAELKFNGEMDHFIFENRGSGNIIKLNVE